MSLFKTQLTLLALLFSASLLLAPMAQATPANDTCAAPVPLDELASLVGQPGIKGYTVVQGDTIEEFDVEILGVQDNAPYPGGKIVIARASGDPITAAGGGSASGMSGSPIYTATGELIGALAYGFSLSPSPIIGITPAELMIETPPAANTLSPIRLEKEVRESVAGQGFSIRSLNPLLPVVSVSGSLKGSVAKGFEKEMNDRGLHVVSGRGASRPGLDWGSRGSVLPDPSKSLLPGETVFADLSYGRSSFGTMGTVTRVCDGQFLGFGHSFLNNVASRAVVSRGEVLAMIIDETRGPRKYGVATEPVGTMTLDNIFALGGNLGQATETVDVNGGVVDITSGRAFYGMMTQIAKTPDPAVSDYEWFSLPYLATMALTNEIAALTKRGPSAFGTVTGGWRIEGRSKSGPFSFTRSDAWTGYDAGDGFFSYGAAGDALYLDLDRILGYSTDNPYEGVRINSIEPEIEIRSKLSYLRPLSLSWKKAGAKSWSSKKQIRGLKKGQKVSLRLRFRRVSDGRIVERFLAMRATKNEGNIAIVNHISGGGQANSFTDLLGQMREDSNIKLRVQAKGLSYDKKAAASKLVFDRPLTDTYFELGFSG